MALSCDPYRKWAGVAFCFAASLACPCISSAYSQDPVGNDKTEGGQGESDRDQLKSRFSTMAKKITIAPQGQPNRPFHFESQPALSWSNPARKTSAGAMFLWTDSGRPKVALCVYPDGTEVIDLEFQSLSEGPLTADSGDQLLWQPSESGLTWETIQLDQQPKKSPFQRLRQMRTIAREFSARLTPPNKNPIELRLLETPVYRYKLPKQAPALSFTLIDGAIFCFVQGTDPEVIVMLEAHEEKNGERTWRYALARMSMVPMQVYRNAALVWELNWAIQRSQTPYYTYKSF